MPVKIRSFGGPVVWLLRKHCSGFTSKVMLSFAANRYKKSIHSYMEWFVGQKELPIFVNCMIETLNRCNGTC